MNNGLLSHRHLFLAVALLTATAMGSALYLQYVVGLTVCPLCLTQRLFFVSAGVVAFLGGLHNPAVVGRRIYAALGLVLTGAGLGFAGRHVWLQYLPADEVPACGPSLEYMLDTLPFAETFKIMLMGDGNCAETVWTFLGFSIPELAVGVFLVMAGLFITLLMRRESSTSDGL